MDVPDAKRLTCRTSISVESWCQRSRRASRHRKPHLLQEPRRLLLVAFVGARECNRETVLRSRDPNKTQPPLLGHVLFLCSEIRKISFGETKKINMRPLQTLGAVQRSDLYPAASRWRTTRCGEREPGH